ncbi:Rz1 family lipoprotein [Serratia plymuthica]|uniref:Rz1 family lipoprotein n=1 Tax=Serratia plymuthica TaxID=82996 RepID=A0A7T2WB89_SERPL|nr:Rz1 family lipoprotein [Serratia plymuthica]QPS20143.1 Rz1 family lipoprotein [Serratia plymuthica]QPS57745.1 Rz1 family lipoprotein [Serratia plymuthica]QPS61758.1 Rz1 family lipoprotein [Serratia plymuthica]UNK29919.1 Rz1 family lipoprotein [Serratia plymuthica]
MRLNKRIRLCALSLTVVIAGCSSLDKKPVQTKHPPQPAAWAMVVPSNSLQILDSVWEGITRDQQKLMYLQSYIRQFCLRE